MCIFSINLQEILEAAKNDSNYYNSKFSELSEDEKMERAISETVDYIRDEFYRLVDEYNVDVDLWDY